MKFTYSSLFFCSILIISACSAESFEVVPKETAIVSTVNIKDMTVSFYDFDNKKKLVDWDVKRPYIGGLILPDKDTFLLYGKTIDSVDLYSLSEGKKIASWETGKGIVNGILVNDGKEIAFADQNRDSVRFFNLEGKEIKEVKTGQNPLTLLADDTRKLFVMSFNQEDLSIIDLHGKKKLPGFKIHSASAGAFLHVNNNELWIGGHGEGNVAEDKIHIYDLASGKLKKKISAPVMPVNFENDDENIYVLSHGSSTLYKLGENGEEKAAIKVGANPFEMQWFHNKLIVAGYDSNDFYIINPESFLIEGKVKVGKGPFQLVTRERSR